MRPQRITVNYANGTTAIFRALFDARNDLLILNRHLDFLKPDLCLDVDGIQVTITGINDRRVYLERNQ